MLKGKVVILNTRKMNYDGRLDLSGLAEEVVTYDDTTTQQVLERAEGATVVVTKELPVPKEVMAQLPACVKLIVECGTGYNNLDVVAAKEKGIIVCNVPNYSTQRVAHTTIMHLLALSSSLHQQIRMIAKGDYRNFTDHLMVSHTEVNGKTLGIIGAGTIGREVMRIAKALDMQILVYTRTPREDEEGISYVSLDEVLRKSDYLSLHCALTPATHHIIDEAALAKMKPTAYLINTARGPLIDQAALITALKNQRLAGAALDVQEVEPLPEDSPLYEMDNVIITPHIGWQGLETRQRMIDILRNDIEAFDAGTPINVVN